MRVLPYHLPLVAERGEGSRVWDVDGNRIHRPEHGLRAAAAGASTPPGDRSGHSADQRARQPIGISDGDHDPRGGKDQATVSQHGTDAVRQFRNRSLRFGGAAGADLHRPAEAGHVRGSLSRLERGGFQSLSRAADRSFAHGLWTGDPRHQRHVRQRRGRDRGRLEQPRCPGAVPGRTRLGRRRRDDGAGDGQCRAELAARGLSASASAS